MLNVLVAVCLSTLDAIRGADYPVDAGLVEHVERVVAQAEAEIGRH
jgi:hypothetical protein